MVSPFSSHHLWMHLRWAYCNKNHLFNLTQASLCSFRNKFARFQSNMFHTAENWSRVETCSSGNNCWNVMPRFTFKLPLQEQGASMQASSSSSWQILHSTKTPLVALPSSTAGSHAVIVEEGASDASSMADWSVDSVSNRPAITSKWSAISGSPRRPSKHKNDEIKTRISSFEAKGNKRQNHYLNLEDRNKNELIHVYGYSKAAPFLAQQNR